MAWSSWTIALVAHPGNQLGEPSQASSPGREGRKDGFWVSVITAASQCGCQSSPLFKELKVEQGA